MAVPALSTLGPITRARGLAVGLEEVLAGEPSALLLETIAADPSAAAAAAKLQAGRMPLLGVRAPFGSAGAGEEGQGLVALGAEEPERAQRALDRVRRTAKLAAKLGGVPVLIPTLGAASSFAQADAPPSRSVREGFAERLCRAFFSLEKEHPGLPFTLVPGGEVQAPDDAETLSWVLEERPGVGLALETGLLGARAAAGGDALGAWFALPGAGVRLALLTDHDGEGRTDLWFGTGRLEHRELRGLLGRETPLVARADPRIGMAAWPIVQDAISGLR